MKIRIEIDAAGNVSAFTESGTFEEGKEKIKKIFKDLKVNIPFTEIGEPEQHRHEDQLVVGNVHQHS